jgi:hypothetical protein
MAEFDLDELDRIFAAATPGKWKLWADDVRADLDGSSDVGRSELVARTYSRPDPVTGAGRCYNAVLIAELQRAYPSLSAELRQSRARVEELEAARLVPPADDCDPLRHVDCVEADRVATRDAIQRDERIRTLEAELAEVRTVHHALTSFEFWVLAVTRHELHELPTRFHGYLHTAWATGVSVESAREEHARRRRLEKAGGDGATGD